MNTSQGLKPDSLPGLGRAVQAAFGLQIKLNERMDLRVEPFQFFHVSNGYLAASNPGMDQLASRIGISYYVGNRHAR
jgi:hypothetical protein